MRFRQSNWGTLGPDVRQASEQQYIAIQEAMHNELGEYGPINHFELDMALTAANDIDELWKLRPALLEVLKSRYGEAAARQRMDRISQKFIGLHPAARGDAPGA